MRTLRFIVDSQRVTRDPNCDFSNIVAGTTGYLRAQFTFSPEWDSCVKVARFWRGRKEHAVRLSEDKCEIPPEVLTGITFGVSIIGQRDNYRITTNKILVRQEVNE